MSEAGEMTDSLARVMAHCVRDGAARETSAPDEDFYDAGFTSLSSLKLLMQLETEWDVSIPDDEFIVARSARVARRARHSPEGWCAHAPDRRRSKAAPTRWRRKRFRSRSPTCHRTFATSGSRPMAASSSATCPTPRPARLEQDVRELAGRLQRSLRRLQRKVLFRSAAADSPVFRGVTARSTASMPLGPGQMALEGLPLALFRYFDRDVCRARRRLGGAAGADADADSGARPVAVRLLPLVSTERHVREPPARRPRGDRRVPGTARRPRRPRRWRARRHGDARGVPLAGRLLSRLSPSPGPVDSRRRHRRTRSAASASATRPATPATCAACGTSRCAKSSSWAPGSDVLQQREAGIRRVARVPRRASARRRNSHRQRPVLHRARRGGEDLLPAQLGDEVRDLAPAARRRARGGRLAELSHRLLRPGVRHRRRRTAGRCTACVSPSVSSDGCTRSWRSTASGRRTGPTSSVRHRRCRPGR